MLCSHCGGGWRLRLDATGRQLRAEVGDMVSPLRMRQRGPAERRRQPSDLQLCVAGAGLEPGRAFTESPRSLPEWAQHTDPEPWEWIPQQPPAMPRQAGLHLSRKLFVTDIDEPPLPKPNVFYGTK